VPFDSWDELDLASADLGGLMDGVYQQDKACLVKDFIYHTTNSISGQTDRGGCF
jgi:hypothetical protein